MEILNLKSQWTEHIVGRYKFWRLRNPQGKIVLELVVDEYNYDIGGTEIEVWAYLGLKWSKRRLIKYPRRINFSNIDWNFLKKAYVIEFNLGDPFEGEVEFDVFV